MAVLTARAFELAKPDPAKRREVPDAALPGLYLVVQPAGGKSWAVRYRAAGKPRKLTLGPQSTPWAGGCERGSPHRFACRRRGP